MVCNFVDEIMKNEEIKLIVKRATSLVGLKEGGIVTTCFIVDCHQVT